MSATRSKYAPITPAERARIVATHRETGWSAWRVATTLGHDRMTVVAVLSQECGYVLRPNKKYNHAEILAYHFANGRNLYGTAKHFGCDRGVVRHAMKMYERNEITVDSDPTTQSTINRKPKYLAKRIRPTNAWAEASSFEVREIIGDIMGVVK